VLQIDAVEWVVHAWRSSEYFTIVKLFKDESDLDTHMSPRGCLGQQMNGKIMKCTEHVQKPYLPVTYHRTGRSSSKFEDYSEEGCNTHIILNSHDALIIAIIEDYAAILDFEKQLPFLYYLTNHHQIWWKCCHYDLERMYEVTNLKYQSSTWRLPPSWISKNCCHIFAI